MTLTASQKLELIAEVKANLPEAGLSRSYRGFVLRDEDGYSKGPRSRMADFRVSYTISARPDSKDLYIEKIEIEDTGLAAIDLGRLPKDRILELKRGYKKMRIGLEEDPVLAEDNVFLDLRERGVSVEVRGGLLVENPYRVYSELKSLIDLVASCRRPRREMTWSHRSPNISLAKTRESAEAYASQRGLFKENGKDRKLAESVKVIQENMEKH